MNKVTLQTPLLRAIATLMSLLLVSTAFGQNLRDDFSNAEQEGRSALRGDWKFDNQTASCIADPELFKKFKNHGPILRWPIEFSDGTVQCEFKPSGCEKVVLTLNQTGHVFRIILASGTNPRVKSRVVGWAGPSKTTDHEVLATDGIPTVSDLHDGWVKVRISFEGENATLIMGDASLSLKHPSIARKKGEFTLSFASGELAMRNVAIDVKN